MNLGFEKIEIKKQEIFEAKTHQRSLMDVMYSDA
jgi:hypothetical protein